MECGSLLPLFEILAAGFKSGSKLPHSIKLIAMALRVLIAMPCDHSSSR